ncbi:hypothetical protein D3C76_796900 [compost metagenome]
MRHAPSLVTAQYLHIRQPLATLTGVDQHLGQHCSIEEAQVDALPGQRVNGVRGIADQCQAFIHIALGVALAQRHAHPRVGLQHITQAPLESPLKGFQEGRFIQRHQLLGMLRGGRPHDRAPVLLAIAGQRQERQWPFIGEALPGRGLVPGAATHAGDDGMVQVIPLAGFAAGQAPHCRVGTVGRDHQRRTQLAAIGEGQQPLVAGAAQLFEPRIGQQADIAVMQALQQAILHHPVLDDVAEHLGMHAGSREVNLPGAAAIPHMHVRVWRGTPLGNAIPGAKALENALAGRRQRADTRLERGLGIERLDRQRAAVEQEDLQATVAQRQGQGAADHTGTDNQQICAHFHALRQPRLRLEPHV